MRLLPKRVQTVRRNLESCFPDMPTAEREALIRSNFEQTGMALFDTANVFVPFFGVPASTSTGATALTKLGRAKVMPLFVERNADHSGYRIEILPPLDNFPGGDEQADTERCNRIIEQLVLRRPNQYMWLHRRFKTRPDPSDYLAGARGF